MSWNPAADVTMEIQATPYGRWSQAYRCTAEGAELIVVTEVGPRILSLRWEGSPNLLYEDQSGLRFNGWSLYGGHRFTVAPESHQTYAIDDAPCSVAQSGHELRVIQPVGPDGTQRWLTIGAPRDGIGFDLRHELRNHGSSIWQGALWAITCVPPVRVVAPKEDASPRYWPGTEPGEWQLAPDHVCAGPCGEPRKIGWYSSAAWLASLQPFATLVIHAPGPPSRADCVDEGCNLELYTCRDYFELETLGGAVAVPPGGFTCHEQRWRLLRSGFGPEDWAEIGVEAGCAEA